MKCTMDRTDSPFSSQFFHFPTNSPMMKSYTKMVFPVPDAATLWYRRGPCGVIDWWMR